jgi:prepilin-type N-terminal cleavage/methylation domain-containing protein
MRRFRDSGFSLLEVLVSLLLVSLVLMLATRLLREVHLTSVEVQRTLPDSVPQFAIQLLRHDIQRSRRISTSPGGGPLGLEQADGSRVVYDETLGQLVRTVLDADGSVLGERAVMRDVWRWSWHDGLMPGLVELQIGYRRHREPGRRRLGGLRSVQDSSTETETLTLRFNQRARPGRRVF